MGKSERRIQFEIREFIGGLDDFVIFRNNTGEANLNGRRVKFGLCVGSSDLIGIHKTGRFIALELKTDKGKPSDDQKRFISLINKYGGAAAVLRSLEDAQGFVESVRNEEDIFCGFAPQ